MKSKIADINELRQQSNMPNGDYALETVTIKEIMDKYPDKVVDILDREVINELRLKVVKLSVINLDIRQVFFKHFEHFLFIIVLFLFFAAFFSFFIFIEFYK